MIWATIYFHTLFSVVLKAIGSFLLTAHSRDRKLREYATNIILVMVRITSRCLHFLYLRYENKMSTITTLVLRRFANLWNRVSPWLNGSKGHGFHFWRSPDEYSRPIRQKWTAKIPKVSLTSSTHASRNQQDNTLSELLWSRIISEDFVSST